MPRAGQTKPPLVPRLPDRIAIGVVTRTFPPELVDRVVTGPGGGEQRQRLLPARVVLYYTLAMSLFTQAGYEEVMWPGTPNPAVGGRWPVSSACSTVPSDCGTPGCSSLGAVGQVEEQAEVAIVDPAGLQDLAVDVCAELLHCPRSWCWWMAEAPGYPARHRPWRSAPACSGRRPQPRPGGDGMQLHVDR
jgi:Insertion element 4 transposase N-terminal